MPIRRGRVPFRRLPPVLLLLLLLLLLLTLLSLQDAITVFEFGSRLVLVRRLRSRTTWSNNASASCRWLSLEDSISVMARLKERRSPLSTPSARPRARGLMAEVEKAQATLTVQSGIDKGGRLMGALAAVAAAVQHSCRRMMMSMTMSGAGNTHTLNYGREFSCRKVDVGFMST